MYYYYHYCKKEVHQNIFETKRLSGVDAEENFRLFTNRGCHGYSEKQMVDADWRVDYSKNDAC